MYSSNGASHIPFLSKGRDSSIPVALISLTEASNRRDVLRGRGVPQAWLQNYWSGIDMRRENYSSLDNYSLRRIIERRTSRTLRVGEVGCALSHLAVQRWLAVSEFPMALVLEDDIVPKTEDWINDLEDIARAFISHAKSGSAFICHLGPPAYVDGGAISRSVRFSGSQPKINILLHTDPVRTIWRAQAYFISREAAIRSLKLEQKVMTLADDWCERRRLKLIDEIFFVRPMLIGQDEDIPSQIRPLDHGEGFVPTVSGQPFAIRIVGAIKAGKFLKFARSSIRYRLKNAVARALSYLPYNLR